MGLKRTLLLNNLPGRVPASGNPGENHTVAEFMREPGARLSQGYREEVFIQFVHSCSILQSTQERYSRQPNTPESIDVQSRSVVQTMLDSSRTKTH